LSLLITANSIPRFNIGEKLRWEDETGRASPPSFSRSFNRALLRERARETEYSKIHKPAPSSLSLRALIGDKRLITRRKLQAIPYRAVWRYKLSALYREISNRKAQAGDRSTILHMYSFESIVAG